MSSTRSVKSPGIFANAASTVIPTTPIAGASYRNAVSGAAAIAQGWPYAIKVNSAEFNQILYQYTSLVDVMDKQGVLGWTNLVDYAAPALVFGSDFKLYLCTNANGPATTVQDPVSAPAYWKIFDPSGFLSNLVDTPIRDSAGVQRFGLATGGSTSIQGQGSTPIDFKNAAGTVLGQWTTGGELQGSVDAVSTSAFPRFGQLNSRPGHTYLTKDWTWLDKPGGLIVQWGTETGPLAGSSSFTFATNFPNSCLAVVASQDEPVIGNNSIVQIYSRGTSGFTMTSSQANTIFSYFAIGF